MSARPLLSVELAQEQDLVHVRQRARQLAGALGLEALEQTRLATAVSEIARNALRYARGGVVRFLVDTGERPELVVRVCDTGPGIPHLDQVLGGGYRSTTGMGLGIVGARRLADRFDIRTTPGQGTEVELARSLPATAGALGPRELAALVDALPADEGDAGLEAAMRERELLRTLAELRARQEEVERLNRELEETNRGVVALYAELDQRAEDLRRASELKSRFLSNVSHELRTPLSSIINLGRLLLDDTDGPALAGEQRRTAELIARSANGLYEIVNDLLDLAKIEAGKVDLRPVDVTVEELFAALRGLFRPMLRSDAVALVFDEPLDLPPLRTDEAKLAQVLRNFVSNALKYTERGVVRVAAEAGPDDTIAFHVSDTGIGIPAEHLDLVFEEFVQLENPLQKHHKGTGLGLPLTRRLAGLLGGQVLVRSTLGEGSVFSVVIPRVLPHG